MGLTVLSVMKINSRWSPIQTVAESETKFNLDGKIESNSLELIIEVTQQIWNKIIDD